MKEELAIALLSGGIDSAVALWWAKKEGLRLYSLSFDYYLRNPKEAEAARLLAQIAGVEEHRTLQLDFLKELGDEPPSPSSALARMQPPRSYIPARNAIFYSVAASWGERLGASYLIGGHNRSDPSDFPDASEAFLSALSQVLSQGLLTGWIRPLKILMPLAKMDKTAIVKLGLELGVPFQHTWSCYGLEPRPCGKCKACLEREVAFKRLGLEDPLLKALRGAGNP